MGGDLEAEPLDESELATWRGFLRWSEGVTARVERDLADVCGLSAADYRVLLGVQEAGGTVPQRTLQTTVGWTATRLSHQLARMEHRGLLVRRDVGPGRAVQVQITEHATRLLARSRPAHAQSVRHHLLNRLTPDQRAMIRARSTFSDDAAGS